MHSIKEYDSTKSAITTGLMSLSCFFVVTVDFNRLAMNYTVDLFERRLTWLQRNDQCGMFTPVGSPV